MTAESSVIGLKYGYGVKSILTSIDPVTKLFFILILSIFPLISTDIYEHIIILLSALFFTLVLGKMPLDKLAKPMVFPLLAIIPNLIIYPPLYEWGRTGVLGLNYTFDAVATALILSNRIASVAIAFFGFIYSTHPRTFGQALEQLGISYRISQIFSLSLVLLPVIEDESRKVMYSHTLSGSWKRLSLGSIRRYLFSLLAMLFQRIQSMSIAMECRGFGSHKTRTHMHPIVRPKHYRLIRFCLIMSVVVYVVWCLLAGKSMFLYYKQPVS